MGSFRSAAARATDVQTLTAADRPEGVAEGDWLAEGEWIKYLTKLPHRAAVRLADEGTVPEFDRRGKKVTSVRIRAGTLQQIKLEEGIVDWSLTDETGSNVRWDRAQAALLLEGLPQAVRQRLGAVIGSDSPTDSEDADPADEEAGKVEPGND